MDCRTIYEVLGAFLDGETSPFETREIEVHLAECPKCHGLVVNCRAMIRLYRDQAPRWASGAVPDELHRRMMDKVLLRRPSDHPRNPTQ